MNSYRQLYLIAQKQHKKIQHLKKVNKDLISSVDKQAHRYEESYNGCQELFQQLKEQIERNEQLYKQCEEKKQLYEEFKMKYEKNMENMYNLLLQYVPVAE